MKKATKQVLLARRVSLHLHLTFCVRCPPTGLIVVAIANGSTAVFLGLIGTGSDFIPTHADMDWSRGGLGKSGNRQVPPSPQRLLTASFHNLGHLMIDPRIDWSVLCMDAHWMTRCTTWPWHHTVQRFLVPSVLALTERVLVCAGERDE